MGSFFHDALLDEDPSERVSADHREAIRIEATVYDGEGDPLSDAMVEIWQANGAGRYNDPVDDREDLLLDEGFSGFGRPGTDAGGRFSFVTVKPGPVPGPDGGMQAPQLQHPDRVGNTRQARRAGDARPPFERVLRKTR